MTVLPSDFHLNVGKFQKKCSVKLARGSAGARLVNMIARLGSTKCWLRLGSARKKLNISGSWLGSAWNWKFRLGLTPTSNRCNFQLYFPGNIKNGLWFPTILRIFQRLKQVYGHQSHFRKTCVIACKKFLKSTFHITVNTLLVIGGKRFC